MGLLRALKALGLTILNFCYRSRGDRGSISVLITVIGERMLLIFVRYWWMYIFELLLLGKVVSEVE